MIRNMKLSLITHLDVYKRQGRGKGILRGHPKGAGKRKPNGELHEKAAHKPKDIDSDLERLPPYGKGRGDGHILSLIHI